MSEALQAVPAMILSTAIRLAAAHAANLHCPGCVSGRALQVSYEYSFGRTTLACKLREYGQAAVTATTTSPGDPHWTEGCPGGLICVVGAQVRFPRCNAVKLMCVGPTGLRDPDKLRE